MVVIHKDVFFANIPGVEHGDCHLDLYLPDDVRTYERNNEIHKKDTNAVNNIRNKGDKDGTYNIVNDIRETNENQEHINNRYSRDKFNDDSGSSESKSVPFVLFIHGGGWRRGGRSAWKHYLFFDVNFLVAFLQYFIGSYGNIGEVLAQNNIACAIVSYPLTEAGPVVLIVEMLLSYIQSVFVIFVLCLPIHGLLLLFLYGIVDNSRFYVTRELIYLENGVITNLNTLFLITLTFTNSVIATLFFFKRKEFNISIMHIRLFGLSLFAVLVLSFYSNSLLHYLAISTLILTQTMIFYQRIRRYGSTYDGQVKAVAQAVRWAKCFCEETGHIDINRLYLMGHSAGGHLATLSALDESILAEVACSTEDVKGVISISGVYDLLCLNKHWLRHVYLEPTFGTSSKQWLQASPEHLAQRSKSANTMPKFLLILAEYDIFLKSQSYKFAQTLGKLNLECKHVEISKSNHFNVVTNTSTGKGTTLSYVIEFIK
ncbi:uncharacterized protein LOC132741641 [Ruditapes philippinarum]|uniref:uncharacterized protein LOC132741641 n=1 Tax=Ruditapes philippinarum TaxID=129788 RepID=UPI00295B7F8F|nr:uncharacterized protein LOC132741641 [Ruditapes philippinarum]